MLILVKQTIPFQLELSKPNSYSIALLVFIKSINTKICLDGIGDTFKQSKTHTCLFHSYHSFR